MHKLIKTSFVLVAVLSSFSFAGAQAVLVATIQGQLLKSDGKPLAYTEIELVPTTSSHILNDSRLIGVSSLNGKFSFFDVPPGSYTMSINFDDKPTNLSPYGTYFFPGTVARNNAELFEITTATRIRGLIFKLAPQLVGRKIAGNVNWSDGSPVKNAVIGCRDIEYDRTFSYTCGFTDGDGRFSVEGFVGRKYQIGAIVFDKPYSDQHWASSIIGAGETGVFDLELSTTTLNIKVFPSKEFQTIVDKYLG
jgi:hypothetical protein